MPVSGQMDKLMPFYRNITTKQSGFLPDSFCLYQIMKDQQSLMSELQNISDIHNIENSDKEPRRTDRTGAVWLHGGQVYLGCGKINEHTSIYYRLK